VAAAASVSTQTVSRVINERPDVSPDTRKKVQEVIARMGYQPSALARSLIRQRSYTIGVVTAGLGLTGPSRTLSGITGAAEAAGYAILLKELTTFDTENVNPIILAFLSRHVDGIIWAVPEVMDNRKWVNKNPMDLEIPMIFLTMEPQQEISVVSINNYLGGRMATKHLLEQGYRQIGHISGPLDWWEARQRMAGWRDVLTESGMTVLDNHWVEGDWSSSSGAEGFDRLVQQYPEMDAIFIANDQTALGVMKTACERKLKIPDSLGIVGFDNIAESKYFWPPLTTVQQDLFNLGRIALEEMIKIIEAGWQGQETQEPKSILLTPTLVVRQSSFKIQRIGR
jgi:DNA-binding LacI/PurR family transcriptional regulator